MNRQAQIEAFTLAAHRLAIDRLRERPARLDDALAVLKRWRDQAGPTRSDLYWDEWTRLLSAGVDEVERAVCHDGERAAVLRSTSPLGTLITQHERTELLLQARAATT